MVTGPMPPARPLVLSPSLQRYDWGDPSFLPALLGLPAGSAPCAEAWYGDHPRAPSRAHVDGRERPLDAVLAAAPVDYLGVQTEARTGQLPFLLKILAAAKPLSVQVHPNRAQAAAGFAREEAAGIPRDAPERRYRDPNHKPELVVALTDFHALCGFRPLPEIATTLAELPELSELLPRWERTPSGLESLLRAYFALTDDVLQPALQRLIGRLEAHDARAPFRTDQPEHWALRAHRELSTNDVPDRGLIFVFLLALIHLRPGQGLFLPSGLPHSYLHGAAVELMASSDNVLRAGLTSKHVDVEELMAIVRFDAGAPPVLDPIPLAADKEATYAIPDGEIELRRIDLGAGTTFEVKSEGPETLLALPASRDDALEIDDGHGTIVLQAAQSVLLPAGRSVALRASGPTTVWRARQPSSQPVQDFRSRRPVRLTFGTSGLRGKVDDITDLEAYINARGFLDFLISTGGAVPGSTVAIGGDLRPSTDGPERSITRAVARAVLDAGLRVANCGRIPTPALTAYAVANGWPSIMVTGSHIPFDRNGIKFNRRDGEISKADETPILAAVERRRRLEYARDPDDSPFDDDGWFRSAGAPTLPAPSDAAADAYVARYVGAFGDRALRGLRVALYEHSAVGRDLVARVLRELGAEVLAFGRSQEFVAIDTEAISKDRLAELQRRTDEVRAQAGPFDAVISTDGDSDRPLVLAVDPDGALSFVPGDLLGALVADALGADAIAVPVSSNDAIDAHFAKRGVPVVRTRIGSPWVIAAMSELDGERRVGWEANGGFLTASVLELETGTLQPLPTRDAALPIVTVLNEARRSGRPLIDLVRALPARFSRSGLLDDVDPSHGRALLEHFAPVRDRVRMMRFGEAVTCLDHAGKEVPVDAALESICRDVRAALESRFGATRGFGAVESIDTLDGIRIRFVNHDIAHVRPSGNAPQLRIYAVADSAARADAIVEAALAEPSGILRELLADGAGHAYADAVQRNIEATRRLFESGAPPRLIGAVSGSEAAQRFWQHWLDSVKVDFRAEAALSLHEDLPVNQAFGLLLAWKRIRSQFEPGRGALLAFVFGEGTRATPITEAECGQKPAISTFVPAKLGAERRYLSTAELALRYFAPVEAFLRRSGFDGLVVKWGDEIQIPTRDLDGTDPLFADADVVRFVSMRPLTEDTAANKDWVGVDSWGAITAFIPRRPLEQMRSLADRGLLQRRGDTLYGGVNLGSIAVSRLLLDALLEEFEDEVDDPTADRKRRPDLDPQLFTALIVASISDDDARAAAWQQAKDDSATIRKLEDDLPDVLQRLRAVLEGFEDRHGRPPRFVALDFEDQYWGDIGQHRQMFDWFWSVDAPGPEGRIARSLARLPETRDENGNLLAGDVRLGPGVDVRNSVLIDARIDAGTIDGSMLVGTRCGELRATHAFDVQSTARALELGARSGSYGVVSETRVVVGAGERATTVFFAEGEVLMRVHEDTDLRDRASTYDQPILGNPISFAEAHARVTAADPTELRARRAGRRRELEALLDST
jgi:phosphomannomutase